METLQSFLASEKIQPEVQARILQFYEIVLKENQVQNLTRLTSPRDFFEGHVLDAIELLKVARVEFPAIDLGSGVGVPGVLASILRNDSWLLVESEKRKADFLQRAVQELGLSQTRVHPVRIEDLLRKKTPNQETYSVVARAVGPIERIYGWIRGCSTWNSIILLKGPGWDEEWDRFKASKFGKELRVVSDHKYLVGEQQKQRRIVKLITVPRGT